MKFGRFQFKSSSFFVIDSCSIWSSCCICLLPEVSSRKAHPNSGCSIIAKMEWRVTSDFKLCISHWTKYLQCSTTCKEHYTTTLSLFKHKFWGQTSGWVVMNSSLRMLNQILPLARRFLRPPFFRLPSLCCGVWCWDWTRAVIEAVVNSRR